MSHSFKKAPPLFEILATRQGRRQLREIGGAKIFADFRKLFSGRNFNVFFRPKAGDLQKKKKVFAEIRRLFLTEITNFNRFFRPKKATSSSQKKYRGGQEINGGGKNRKSGRHCPPLLPHWRRACYAPCYAPGVKKYYLLSPSSLVGKLSCNTDWTGLSPDSFYGPGQFFAQF